MNGTSPDDRPLESIVSVVCVTASSFVLHVTAVVAVVSAGRWELMRVMISHETVVCVDCAMVLNIVVTVSRIMLTCSEIVVRLVEVRSVVACAVASVVVMTAMAAVVAMTALAAMVIVRRMIVRWCMQVMVFNSYLSVTVWAVFMAHFPHFVQQTRRCHRQCCNNALNYRKEKIEKN